MKSMETWEFAHKHFGRTWFFCGIALLPVTAALLVILRKSGIAFESICLITIALHIAVMLISILPTEAALRKNFDENGERIAK